MVLSSKQPFLLTMHRAQRWCQSTSRNLGQLSLLFLLMQQRWITAGIACIASPVRNARHARAARVRVARIAKHARSAKAANAAIVTAVTIAAALKR